MMRRQIDAAAHGLLDHGASFKHIGDELPFDLREIRNPFRHTKNVLINAEMDRRLIMSGRHENALARLDLNAEHGRRVKIRIKNQRIVILLRALDVIDERRRPGSLLLEPFHLIGRVVRVVENPIRVPVEGGDVAGVGVGEPADGNAANQPQQAVVGMRANLSQWIGYGGFARDGVVRV